MNLVYLKYFFDAARCQSVSESAKLNHVSQSAISQGIKKLEVTLQKQLMTHGRNAFKLTREGEIVFEHCKDVFRSVNSINEALEREQSEYGGTLECVCSYSLSLSFLPKYLSEFHHMAPKVGIDLRLGHFGITTELVKKGVVEFGVVLDNGDLSSFEKIQLEEGAFRLYRKKGSSFNVEEFCYLMTEDHKETFALRDAVEARYGQAIHLQMQVASWEVIANLTLSGVGIGFFPDYLVNETHREKLLEELHLDVPEIPYKIYAIYPKNERLSRNASKFIEMI